ncbi:hypothetical protein HHX47_DHR2000850 [Lentinula edodes]|nr:hypothetical protein HHX47_DHR2000850 [Lentinula edodes]
MSHLPHFWSSIPQNIANFPVQILTAFLTVFAVNRIWVTVQKLRAVNHLPGPRPPFSPLGIPGVLFPTSWWNTSQDVHWARRSNLYSSNESVSIVPFLIGEPLIWTSNLNVARQIASGGNRTGFFKPRWSARALLLWGMNLFAAEGDTWRKHRRVMGPAFNNELYRLVWAQTMKTYRDMVISEKWEGKASVSVPVVQELTFKVKSALTLLPICLDCSQLALLVLGTCAFGFSFRWIQQSNAAYEAMALFMKEQVGVRKQEIQENIRRDAFSLLVKANEQEESKYQLSDDELIGNVYIMLFAGHETTAHTLAATLGFLALNQDVQDEVFEQIKEVVGYGRDPEIEDYHNLNKVLAAFFEALRLFPSGHLMIREASEDTVLQIPNPRGQEGTIPFMITKGQVTWWTTEYNPRYYDDPASYKPSRWHGINSDSEDFTAFSVGPRACIGRKFATTEAVCFLSMLLRDWKVIPKLNAGETEGEWRARVLDAKLVLTLGVRDVPLIFVPRK